MEDESILDESLECFSGTGPEFRGGLSNHGPMAVEALMRLGRQDMALSWAAKYRERLEEVPSPVTPISRTEWREALGQRRRVTDWVTYFSAELRGAPFTSVAGEWLPRLLPGVMAGGTHGLIRTFHALRALNDQESQPRQDELARALGYWGATYQPLSGDPSPNGTGDLEAAALDLARSAPKVAYAGLISEEMRQLDLRPDYRAAVGSLQPAADIQSAFSELTEIGARAYLANADHAPIGLVHAVTAPAAVRGMLWALPPDDHQLAFSYAWQAVAALIACSAPSGLAPRSILPAAESREEVIQRAVATGDAHAIKLTEAALREDALSPAGAYLLAAADVGVRLGPEG
jgi:hypothetical protein